MMGDINNDETASVKCIYKSEARVLRFKKDVKYDEFIRQISQEFGLPLVVDQYVDAEGTLIRLGESSVLDLSVQFNYKTDIRKSLYDLTVYMRSTENRKNPYDMVTKMLGRRNSYGQITKRDSNNHNNLIYSPRTRTQSTSRTNPKVTNFDFENLRRYSNPDYSHMDDEYNHNRRVSESALKNWMYEPNGDFLYIDDSDKEIDDIEDEIVMNDISWDSDILSGKTPPNISPLDDRELIFNNDFTHLTGKQDIDYHKPILNHEGLTITIPQNNDLNINSDGSFDFPPSGGSSSALRTPTYVPTSSFSPTIRTFVDKDELNLDSPTVIDLPTFHQHPFPNEPNIIIPEEPSPSKKPDTPRTKKKKSSKRPRKNSKNKEKNKGTKDHSKQSETILEPSNLPFKWKKGDLIGKGAFGNVYKGLLSTGQFVAVKHLELPPDINPEKNSHFKSFIKEIELLRGLNHPNIVRYIGSSVEQNNVYVFLEFVSGGSISSIINKFGHLDEDMIRTYAKQILVALAYLHENKIAHRDIKGANILIDSEGSVKLADFGCSKMMELKSATGENFETLLGTPFWMAPEVMTQQGHGRKADIWSFGCTLIEMATGTPPWSSQYTQVAALLFDIATSQKIPELPKNVSNEMKDLLTLCLNRDPSKRPSAAELLDHPWFTGGRVKNVTNNEEPKKKILHSIVNLPSNMLIQIFHYLDLEDIHSMSRVSKFFRDFVNRSSVWQNMSLTQWPKLKRYHSIRGESLGNSLLNTSDKLSHWQKLYIVGTRYDKQIRSKTQLNHVMSIKGHSKTINAIRIVDNFTKLITCSSDKKIKMWDMDSTQASSEKAKKAKVSITFRGHTQSVNCFTLIDNTLVSGSSDKSLRIWDIRSEKSSTVLKSHSSPIIHLSSCVTSHKFASTSLDCTVKLWDINSTTLLHTLNPHEKPIRDAKINNNILVTVSEDNTLKAWDIRNFSLIKTFKNEGGYINQVDILGDTILSGSSDGVLKEWSLGLDECKSTFTCLSDKKKKSSSIISLSFDNFNTITVLKNDGNLLFLDYNKEEIISQHKIDNSTHSFDRKGSVIATCGHDKLAKIWILKEP